LKLNLTKQLTTTGDWNMSASGNYRAKQVVTNDEDGVLQMSDSIRVAIQQAKNAMMFEHASRAGEHGRLLRLALNEAEALAWQTEFPHLVFPELAREKARAAVLWHQRQRSLRGATSELAFAE
jgi:hypothetical protein